MLFLALRMKRKDKLNSKSYLKKALFKEMVSQLNVKGYHFTPLQCENKLKTLSNRYNEIVDHNARTGQERKDWI
jgi:hypothetical protein